MAAHQHQAEATGARHNGAAMAAPTARRMWKLTPNADTDVLRETEPPRRGVRRGRDEMAEIVELDSATMRRGNCFVLRENGATGDDGVAAFSSPSGRKRQRTLAERLQELCLSGAARAAASSSSGASASLGNQQVPWNWSSAQARQASPKGTTAAPTFSAFMESFTRWQATAAQRDAHTKMQFAATSGGAAPPPGDEAMEDMDMEQAANADDIDDDDADLNDTDGSQPPSMRVHGHRPTTIMDFFSGRDGQQPLDRLIAAYTAARGADARGQDAQGNELVVASPSVPHALFAFLTTLELQEVHAFMQKQIEEDNARRQEATARTFVKEFCSAVDAEASGTPDIASTYPVQDVDMVDDDEDDEAAQGAPHHAGALSHCEWFLSEDDSDSL